MVQLGRTHLCRVKEMRSLELTSSGVMFFMYRGRCEPFSVQLITNNKLYMYIVVRHSLYQYAFLYSVLHVL
jgi:hypothetical protein